MIVFRFTNAAERQFQKFDAESQKRLSKKLAELKNHPDIFSVLEPLQNLDPATHRLRIGEYRLLLCYEADTFLVLKVGHRREVYR
jgi:mRNA-degrading endonuclease RelE of RelBE toxin-antitoxin system